MLLIIIITTIAIVVVYTQYLTVVNESDRGTINCIQTVRPEYFKRKDMTEVNKTGGLTASPKEAMKSGIFTAKNASSSPSKFLDGAPLNKSASNSSSTK